MHQLSPSCIHTSTGTVLHAADVARIQQAVQEATPIVRDLAKVSARLAATTHYASAQHDRLAAATLTERITAIGVRAGLSTNSLIQAANARLQRAARDAALPQAVQQGDGA